MAAGQTNFGAMGLTEKKVWSRDLWMAARNASFAMQFTGKSENSMIQRITELTKSEKGTKAIITLIADLTGDGVGGDGKLEDSEEELSAFDLEIQVDQLRNANRTLGRLDDQKTIINFRNTSKNVLSYWLGDRIDQMAFLTLAGLDYSFTNTLGDRSTAAFANSTTLESLSFAADVSAPTSARNVTWQGIGGVDNPGSGIGEDVGTAVNMANPSWNMIVELKAYAKDNYIRGIKGPNNSEYFHLFMTPQGMAKLKQDPEFKKNLESGYTRGSSNPLFSGSVVTSDGVIVHEFRHVPNTKNATTKWGSSADREGQAALFCGAQALAFADLGLPYWDEDNFDYGNNRGIAIGKIFGMLKPVFHSNLTGDDQDFGVIRVNTAVDLTSGY